MNNRKTITRKTKTKQIKCRWCYCSFKTMYKWFDHVTQEIYKNDYRMCMMCKLPFNRKEQLFLHVAQHSCCGTIPKRSCIYCGDTFKTSFDCKNHELNCMSMILQGIDCGETLFSEEEGKRLDMVKFKFF